ncbi:MAG: UDP-N-acetylmuramoyl-L-alanine--D-glutamate ligase [Candidatus Rickettsia vulgarisii]
MSSLISQKNKKIGIFGLGKTGTSSYLALNKVASEVICYDKNNRSRENFAKAYGDENLAKLSDSRWKNLDKILLSPGIPLSHEIVKLANSNKIEITSDIELLFEECRAANFIAITGTNGKSTTVSLTSHILQSCGFNYPAAGNIGKPVLSMDFTLPGYVLELSSFQLDLLQNFKAKIAILLNITKDHIDRHGSMENYILAKSKIFDRMDKNSYAIINIDNKIANDIFQKLKEKNTTNLIAISTSEILNNGISVYNNIVYDNIKKITLELPNNKRLQGRHNQENIAASYVACSIIGATPEKIVAAISRFQGLPNRMQYIGNIDSSEGEINFYNDSKATNAEAASKSIGALDNIYWLVGGIAKEGGIEELESLFPKIRKAYLFGQDKENFALTLKGKVDFQICSDLTESFNYAYEDARKDMVDVKNILLAPACASFDQFKNFEERGELFIKLCNSLINS